MVRLAGVVVDEKGQGVPLATVRVGYAVPAPDRYYSTGSIMDGDYDDSEGFFKFCGVPSNTRLTVDANSVRLCLSKPLSIFLITKQVGCSR